MRVASFDDAIVSLGQELVVVDAAGPRRVPGSVGDPYAPYGALTIQPGGHTAWVGGKDGGALRVDLRRRASEAFAFALRDAAFVDDDRIVAAVLDGERHRLVEFSSRQPMTQRAIDLPAPVDLDWPYGTPYRFGVYTTDDWASHTPIRITSTIWGLVAAQANGLCCVRWPDARWDCWRIPLAYQGSIVGFCHGDGVVLTSVHNGRTGDIVWVDRSGVWHDAFDSRWEPLGPCVPSGSGFVACFDEHLVRFAGSPIAIVAKTHVGGRPGDATVDHDGSRAVLEIGDHVAMIGSDALAASLHARNGSIEPVRMEKEREPANEPRWTWTRVDDPTLGAIWCPDRERTDALVRAVRDDATVLQALPGAERTPSDIEEDPAAAVHRALRRTIPPVLDRRRVLAVLERIVVGERDPFIAWMLRATLPEVWRGATPTRPVDDWLAAQLPQLHAQDTARIAVRRAVITADLERTPAWCVRLETEGTTPIVARIVGFDAAVLSAVRREDDDVIRTFDALIEERQASVEIEALPGLWGHLVGVDDEGEALARAGATFEPIVLADPSQQRRLWYGADASGLFVGRRDGRWVVDVTADGLEDVRPTAPPDPRPEVGALVQALVADELLALRAEPDRALLWAVEVAVFGGGGATALEELLVDHEAVDELFADPEQLAEKIAAIA